MVNGAQLMPFLCLPKRWAEEGATTIHRISAPHQKYPKSPRTLSVNLHLLPPGRNLETWFRWVGSIHYKKERRVQEKVKPKWNHFMYNWKGQRKECGMSGKRTVTCFLVAWTRVPAQSSPSTGQANMNGRQSLKSKFQSRPFSLFSLQIKILFRASQRDARAKFWLKDLKFTSKTGFTWDLELILFWNKQSLRLIQEETHICS